MAKDKDHRGSDQDSCLLPPSSTYFKENRRSPRPVPRPTIAWTAAVGCIAALGAILGYLNTIIDDRIRLQINSHKDVDTEKFSTIIEKLNDHEQRLRRRGW